jgi:excisionase family DNA binding protein
MGRKEEKMDENERLLTVPEVADLLRMGTDTIYQYVDQGRIPAIKIRGRMIRFSPSAIRKWVETQSTGGQK